MKGGPSPNPAARDERAFILAACGGERPPAPPWFEWAIAQAPIRERIKVADAVVEYLSWGRPGDPGVLLMHGSSAHAGWWRHIAPFLAKRRHVVALSWSGMGGSDWRPAYSTQLMMQEALAVAEAAGLFTRGLKPALVAHSLGGVACLRLAMERGERFASATVVDTNIDPARRKSANPFATHRHRVYPTVADALARFRFVRSLGRELPYVADLLAREGLTGVEGGGWRWSFDPHAYDRLEIDELGEDIGRVACPLSLIYGARSQIAPREIRERLLALAPVGTKLVVIPDCGHHVMAEQPLALIAALQALV